MMRVKKGGKGHGINRMVCNFKWCDQEDSLRLGHLSQDRKEVKKEDN